MLSSPVAGLWIPQGRCTAMSNRDGYEVGRRGGKRQLASLLPSLPPSPDEPEVVAAMKTFASLTDQAKCTFFDLCLCMMSF